MELRNANRRDYHELVRIRAEWLDWFWKSHPASERWCPALCQVPRIEDETLLLFHLIGKDNRWAVVSGNRDRLQGYILCQNDLDKNEILIAGQTPRVPQSVSSEEVGEHLLGTVLQRAVEQRHQRIRMHFHGFPDEVDFLTRLYQKHGFTCEPWYEMVLDRWNIRPVPHQLEFRSAGEIGREAFFECNVAVGKWPSHQAAKEDCEISERMWDSVEPATDWLTAYSDGKLVGILRVAVSREGIGVLDDIAVIEEFRGRGFGKCLLAQALSVLEGRCAKVRLDCLQDNLPAVHLYQWAGFKVHHEHGEFSKVLAV